MAVKDFTVESLSSKATVVLWESAATGDTGAPFELQNNQGQRGSVQFSGTFNGGTAAVLQGSNDGTTWVTLEDTGLTAISATAAAQVEFSAACRYIRPSVASGTADGVVCTVVLRG